MSDAPVDLFGLEGCTLGEKYAVGAVAARGGFGVVYRARHLVLDLPVAIKVLDGVDRFTGSAREEFLDRFRQEARTLAALNHPALARVLDFGTLRRESGDVPWMALDWLDGQTLEADLAARHGAPRSPREALDLLRPAFDALACAHEAGVSHRDVKPANLMLVRARRGDAPLRVIDFGIAKVAPDDEGVTSGSTATRSEVAAFSPHYAAPEQMARTRTGPWTDVHALALVLTELVTGSRAFRADDGASLLQQIVSPTRPTPGLRGVDVGPWEAVLERALAIRPAERPSDAAALFRALDATVDAATTAWLASPKPAPHDPARGAAETLADAPVPVVSAPSHTPRPAPARTRHALLLAAAMVTAVGLAAAWRARPSSQSARATPPVTTASPTLVSAPVSPPSAPVAPAVIPAPTEPPAPAPVAPTKRAPRNAPTLVRRPRAATGDVPAVPFVAIE